MDFEFLLDDPVGMLPADELFSGGKLMSLQLPPLPAKAPPSRWRDLLGLKKKLYQSSNNASSSSSTSTTTTTTTSSSSANSIRQFLLGNSKSASDASFNFPLLKDFDHLPRLSLDSDSNNIQSHIPRVRIANRAQHDPATGISVDSPRMSSSGKIVFDRSSSSPSSFNGGTRYKHRGLMERSYSANLRVTNFPVCSLPGASKSRVFALFSSHSQSQSHHKKNNSNRAKKESC